MHASGPGKYFASFFAPIYFCQIGCLIFCLSAQKTVICVAQTSSLTHPPQTLPTRGPAPSHALLQVSYATRQKQRPGTPPHGPGSEPENSRGNMEKQRPMLVFLLARPPQIGKVQSLKNRGFLLCTELSALPCLPESLRRLRWFARDSASTRHPVRTCVEPVCCDGENCVCSILFRCIILFRNSGRFGLPGSQGIRHSPTDRRRH